MKSFAIFIFVDAAIKAYFGGFSVDMTVERERGKGETEQQRATGGIKPGQGRYPLYMGQELHNTSENLLFQHF